MPDQSPEIDLLLKRVEERYNRRIATTTDFEALSVVIEHECGDTVSASTLKRLWGYVTSSSAPRVSTLDILCRFIGVKDFKTFCQAIAESCSEESDFFTTKYLCSSDLAAGAKVSVSWLPDRTVVLLHLGSGRFKVESNGSSHLKAGDEFEVSSFMLGYPLYIPVVYRDGAPVSSYIAGRSHGLTEVRVVR